jgi:dienelactone hydrolase
MANQAADVRFVIDQLLAVDGKPGLLGGLIDPHKIGVSGHSDGGVTAAVVAFNTCCRDQRISAAVVMAGAGIDMPGGSYFPPGSPPMLAAQGQDDHSNNPFNSLALYMQDGGGPKYLLSLPGASHDGPFKGDGPDAAAAAQATLDFLDHYLKGRPGAEQLLHDGSVPGVATIQAPTGQG